MRAWGTTRDIAEVLLPLRLATLDVVLALPFGGVRDKEWCDARKR